MAVSRGDSSVVAHCWKSGQRCVFGWEISRSRNFNLCGDRCWEKRGSWVGWDNPHCKISSGLEEELSMTLVELGQVLYKQTCLSWNNITDFSGANIRGLELLAFHHYVVKWFISVCMVAMAPLVLVIQHLWTPALSWWDEQSCSVSGICGGVALLSKLSFTTRFANVVASVPMHIIVVGGEYSLLFVPTGEALIANGKANAHVRLFWILL